METQKTVNLLNGSDNEYTKFATKKWYVIDSETSGAYSENEQIKFLTKSIESSLCDYSNAYILVTENITSKGAPFGTCITKINEAFVDEAKHINITMPLNNLIEYSDNHSDTSSS